jgi:ribonuclease HII
VRKSELKRLQKLTHFEREARGQGFSIIAGVDEAGRGPLAGPVVAAACILPEGLLIEGVDDSKKLNAQKRFELFQRLTQDPEISYGVGIVESQIIDQINILQATMQAMLIAVSRLVKQADFLLVDGPHLPPFSIPAKGLIDGDALSLCIAAASIIAKETRDQIMTHYHSLFPNYGFHNHKGYSTREHLAALQAHGPCPIHRLSFSPCKGKSQESLLN